MTIGNVRLDVISIINEVERKLGLSASSTLTSTSFTRVLLGLLNDVLDETSDYGDWQQMFRETTLTAQSSVGTYELAVSGEVKNIFEVVWGTDAAPLDVRTVQDLRRLQRISSYGTPRQMATIGVSGVNPKFRVYPIPTSAGTFDIAYYKKPRLFDATVTADTTAVPAFPSRVLVQGLYAKALLEENGGEPTREYQMAYSEYVRMRQEALNRFTYDTGSSPIYFTPGRRY